jgi:LAS superfamily LD-carboxypeptidase LdcB
VRRRKRPSAHRTWGALELTGRSTAHVRTLDAAALTLRPDAAAAFLAMAAAARADGLELAAQSSFRDFERQLTIWNGKFLGLRTLNDATGRPVDVRTLNPDERVAAILAWSALPGASRHHWGTDFDVIDRAAIMPEYRVQLEPAEYATGGVFAKLTTWLDAHMHAFGFFRPYVRDLGGVKPEPWHLSYAPAAHQALQEFSVATLRTALESSELEGRGIVLDQIDALFHRYVLRVASPPHAALLNPRLF